MVERVRHMERCMDRVLDALMQGDVTKVQPEIEQLRAYQESGLWLADYEADERGEYPTDLKRGVLSQDSLHDLLCTIDQTQKEG